MKENKLTGRTAIRWKQFNHKTYSVFCSLKKEVNIGVLTIATLAFANVKIASAQNDTIGQLKNMELEEVEVTGTRVPLTEMQSAKMVTVLSRDEIQAAAVHSINSPFRISVSRSCLTLPPVLRAASNCSRKSVTTKSPL